jgi:hypothetical protein
VDDTIVKRWWIEINNGRAALLSSSIMNINCFGLASFVVISVAVNFNGTLCACCSKNCEVAVVNVNSKEGLWSRSLLTTSMRLPVPLPGISFCRSTNVLVAHTDSAAFLLDGETGSVLESILHNNLTSARLKHEWQGVGRGSRTTGFLLSIVRQKWYCSAEVV